MLEVCGILDTDSGVPLKWPSTPLFPAVWASGACNTTPKGASSTLSSRTIASIVTSVPALSHSASPKMRINNIIPSLPPIQLNTVVQVIITFAASLFALRVGAGLYFWRVANNLERPNYTVIKRLPISSPSSPRGTIEVRKYEPYLIAETTIDESSMRVAGGKGFGKCAGYIFGKNIAKKSSNESEKMAMTAPVRSVGEATNSEKMAMTAPVRSLGNQKSGKTKISFVIGSKYNLQNVPKPIDSDVKVRKVDGHYLACTSFSGPPPTDERIGKERDAILQTLANEGIRARGDKEVIVYGYHDPIITPNILRKNEVAVMVDGSSLN